MKRIVLLGFMIISCLGSQATVHPASLFTDHMVLQREKKVPVWGTATPGETVAVEFAGQTHTSLADISGHWCVELSPLVASSNPASLTISGSDSSITYTNIVVGEVWLCSGQSNMAHTMLMLKQPEEELLAATNYPNLRLFKVGRKTNPAQVDTTVDGTWTMSTAEAAGEFSGTATYFGRALCRDLDVPVGLIHCAWGGTPAESWTSRETLETLPFMNDRLVSFDQGLKNYSPDLARANFVQRLSDWQKKNKEGWKPKLWNPYTSPHELSTLYNGMIAPLVPFSIRGVIWYQGESNASRNNEYHELFSSMIYSWRNAWGQGAFPFLFVQLANFMSVQKTPAEGISSTWPYLREAQSETLAVPNTAMAVITDVGAADDIHPRDKKTVGERLVLAARAKAYGEEIVYSGPIFQSLEIDGQRAIVQFDSVGGGLISTEDELKGFAIAGENKVWHWADAQIENSTVIVSSPHVKTPVSVRYNWANNPIGNLYNQEGLPASLFRTDR